MENTRCNITLWDIHPKANQYIYFSKPENVVNYNSIGPVNN